MADDWYDNGGWLPCALVRVTNQTGIPEIVTPPPGPEVTPRG